MWLRRRDTGAATLHHPVTGIADEKPYAIRCDLTRPILDSAPSREFQRVGREVQEHARDRGWCTDPRPRRLLRHHDAQSSLLGHRLHDRVHRIEHVANHEWRRWFGTAARSCPRRRNDVGRHLREAHRGATHYPQQSPLWRGDRADCTALKCLRQRDDGTQWGSHVMRKFGGKIELIRHLLTIR